MYAKVVDNQVTEIGLPEVGYLKDGSSVSGFDLLPDDVLKVNGWLPIEFEQPGYDTATQQLQFEGYIIESGRVISRSIAVDIVL